MKEGAEMQTQSQIPQEILQKLDTLAQKLGVTAQYLWGVLVKQGRIEAITDLVVAAAWGAGFLSLGALAIWGFKQIKKEDCFDEGFLVGLLFTGGIGSLICLGLTISYTIATITPLMNPEYWALQQVMNLFK